MTDGHGRNERFRRWRRVSGGNADEVEAVVGTQRVHEAQHRRGSAAGYPVPTLLQCHGDSNCVVHSVRFCPLDDRPPMRGAMQHPGRASDGRSSARRDLRTVTVDDRRYDAAP